MIRKIIFAIFLFTGTAGAIDNGGCYFQELQLDYNIKEVVRLYSLGYRPGGPRYDIAEINFDVSWDSWAECIAF